MLEFITSLNKVLNDFIWGVPARVCILSVGLYLAVRTGVLPLRKFGYAMKNTLGRLFKKEKAAEGALTPSRRYAPPCPPPWVRATSPVWRAPSPSAAPARFFGCGSARFSE